MIAPDRLKKLRLFTEAEPKALERLAHDMLEKSFAKGDVILREGDVSGSLYLIASGAVTVEKKIEEGRTKVVARLETEEFFGEMSFLDNQPHSANITAASDTTLFILPRASLDGLIKKDPPSALDQVLVLLKGVSSRLRRTTDELVTVFEVARLIGLPLGFDEFINQVLSRLLSSLGRGSEVAFYRWNPFNDEYSLVSWQGEAAPFPSEIDAKSGLVRSLDQNFESVADLAASGRDVKPLVCSQGHILLARSDMSSGRDGLIVCHNDTAGAFDSGKRQMIETIAAVLAPALATARAREEEMARLRLERSRQTGYTI